MPYRALHFEASAHSAERWVDALLAVGALSVEVADAEAGTPTETSLYGEAGEPAVWVRNRLCALFDARVDVEAALASAAAGLDEPAPAHSLAEIADADWVRETQAQFAPLRVAGRLWIVPSWREPVDAGAVNVRLDPGIAFGTGSHPTTLLCLRWLAQNVREHASVLDYGCGSGILAIAAAKLGAGRVAGVDIDPQAIAASRANAAANGVVATFGLPEELRAERFDVVVANILANPLELLAPLLAGRVRTGGHVVLSGILEAQAGRVAAAYARWFNIAPWGSAEGWIGLAGVRCAP
ncbi:MAG TPA: 50S ribosomal protein L11 methyltransferase [Casimicrobiaceae bacterium]|jgi:ribosomal protein L11 methyltransferase|nr:50S ribosomal protein L11 methyltransferase [Casimicrobiaceae bacterium]